LSSSDPFVKIRVGKGSRAPRRQTKTIPKNLNPVWNETFIIPLNAAQRSDRLYLECYDHDKGGDDALGTVEIELGGVGVETAGLDAEVRAAWHALRPLRGGSGYKTRTSSAGRAGLYLAYSLQAVKQLRRGQYHVARRWALAMFDEADKLYQRVLRLDPTNQVKPSSTSTQHPKPKPSTPNPPRPPPNTLTLNPQPQTLLDLHPTP